MKFFLKTIEGIIILTCHFILLQSYPSTTTTQKMSPFGKVVQVVQGSKVAIFDCLYLGSILRYWDVKDIFRILEMLSFQEYIAICSRSFRLEKRQTLKIFCHFLMFKKLKSPKISRSIAWILTIFFTDMSSMQYCMHIKGKGP